MNTGSATRVTVRLPNGTIVCTLDVEQDRNNDSAEPSPAHSNGEPKITEAQRRYLFRLLAEQGIEGKAAEDRLKELFKVTSLADIARSAASQCIQEMVAQTKEAGSNQA